MEVPSRPRPPPRKITTNPEIPAKIEKWRVKSDYSGKDPIEGWKFLPVKEGDIVDKIAQQGSGWVKISFRGETGLVPSSHLEPLQDKPPKPESPSGSFVVATPKSPDVERKSFFLNRQPSNDAPTKDSTPSPTPIRSEALTAKEVMPIEPISSTPMIKSTSVEKDLSPKPMTNERRVLTSAPSSASVGSPVLQRQASVSASDHTAEAPIEPTQTYDICIAGSQCGKSAIVVRFVYDEFHDIDEPTVEDNHKKELLYGGDLVTLKILDTSGSDDHNLLHSEWFLRSQAFVLVYSIRSKGSFDLLPAFFDEISRVKKSDTFPMVLVGTQLDIGNAKRRVTPKQGRDLARKYNCPFVEVSALTGENIDNIFSSLVDEIRYGKRIDPFLQEYPYYKNKWEDLLQLEECQPVIAIAPVGYKIEAAVSPAVNNYHYPSNLKDEKQVEISPNRIFGVTLEECLRKDREKLPLLEIPRILIFMIDLLWKMKAQETSGVFRMSASQAELIEIKKRLNEGDYGIIHLNPSIHTIAGIIKLWFRELAQPLIPANLYSSCVEQPELALKWIDSLPPLNKKVFIYFVKFLQDFSTPEIVAKTDMTRDNLSICIAPSLMRCPHTDQTLIMLATDKEKDFLVSCLDRYSVTRQSVKAVNVSSALFLEREENYISYYHDYFFSEKETFDLVGEDKTGPVVVSIAVTPAREEWRTYVVNKEGTKRLLIPACKEKEAFNVLKSSHPQLEILKLNSGKNQKKLKKELLTFEQQTTPTTYKWGVLYLKDGQDEDAMYANTQGSKNFEDFLKFLGNKVALKGWSKFRGGLDIKNDNTGTHSVYSEFYDSEVMFHVAPMLPYFPSDKQQLERKRHLGNDIVVIVFKESASLFDPSMMKSEFNNIFVVVSQVSKEVSGSDAVHYKMTIVNKDGMPPYGPPIPAPAIFERNSNFRDFLFTKLINGERAALQGCPAFRNKTLTARRIILEENIRKNFGKK